MRRTRGVCALVVIVLIGAVSAQGMAQGFSWWAYDSVLEEIQDRGALRVGLGLFAPWSACNEEGELIGFEIDVATKLAEDIGVMVEFERTNWNYIIPALVAEEFDAIISGLAILPGRNLKVNYTSPYNGIGVYLVANVEKASDLETLADFNSSSVTIATRRGASSVGFVVSVFPDAMLLLFDTDTEVIEAVVSGDAHAAASFEPNQQTWVEANPETLYLPFEEPFASEVGAMAIRKGDLDTLNFFNSWIAANKANGWLEQRRHYWFETREWADQVATDPDTIAECDESFQ
ncbi:MAG: transporter substrate-binding domain-containing protein [Candidatus Aminicenantes bacterium]|nr:transporter substrate-binding domain-containing protein [Candidatus Aminicenantes bacterium]